MSALARTHEAVNLGQGFPDFGWPADLLERAATAVTSGWNQYPPMRGLPELREAIAAHYASHQGMEVTPEQVIVTSGATEALASSLMALVQPGDEVVLFEPLYDAYLPLVLRAGGVPRLITLTPPDWRITEAALAEAFGPRTRLAVFNNPHNPGARVFDEDELALLAAFCVRHDVLALSDEVWEHLVFDGRRHVPLASLPGMADRTAKVGSAGKMFSLTGWKVGWVVAPPEMAEAIARTHQFVTFCTATPLQSAVAYGLAKPMADVERTCAEFAAARDHLREGLERQGYATLPAEGTYFMCVDLDASGIGVGDVEFCERAVREAGVAAIPVSALCAQAPVTNVVRLCFAKQAETLAAGIERLGRARALFA